MDGRSACGRSCIPDVSLSPRLFSLPLLVFGSARPVADWFPLLVSLSGSRDELPGGTLSTPPPELRRLHGSELAIDATLLDPAIGIHRQSVKLKVTGTDANEISTLVTRVAYLFSENWTSAPKFQQLLMYCKNPTSWPALLPIPVLTALQSWKGRTSQSEFHRSGWRELEAGVVHTLRILQFRHSDQLQPVQLVFSSW